MQGGWIESTTPLKIGPDILFIASQRGGGLKTTGTKKKVSCGPLLNLTIYEIVRTVTNVQSLFL